MAEDRSWTHLQRFKREVSSDTVKEIEKKLYDLQQMFMDMSVMVEAQGDMLDDIETQVGPLNVDGYYNSLLSVIDKAVEEGFISQSARHIIGWDFIFLFFF